MKISVPLGYAGDVRSAADEAAEMEKAGVDRIWVAEAYGMDAVSTMGYLAAKTERAELASGILPIYSRTPTLLAMTAVGIDTLSEGRCVLGLGASGPQVIEGFHGVSYDAPVGRTREVMEICRKIWAREAPLEHEGRHYQIPLPPEQGTGLGKALKIITHPPRRAIPMVVASLGPKNVEMTAEVADGWLPTLYVPERADTIWGDDLARGRAKRDPSLGRLEIVAGGALCIGSGSDFDAVGLRDRARPQVALYVGGMGAVGRNFYNTLFSRYGWESEAHQIQQLYLAGHKDEAAAKVPAEFLELSSLIGDEAQVADRLAAYAEAGVTHLNVRPVGPDPLGQIRRLAELIG